MKMYLDVDHFDSATNTNKVYTEDELQKDYQERRRNGELADFYDTFEYYLESCLTRNNGSLIEITEEVM